MNSVKLHFTRLIFINLLLCFLYINNELSERERGKTFYLKLYQNDKIARNKFKKVKDLFIL